ncbi:hypothetical protein [Citrobacter sp. Cpo102]|uniref:hypothetical protein n=1 Tax=Citrobacter sp. Cpo102 TaxID=2985142 RepID=UPI002578B225|nr:hypothetical protein [Citrobacter sp. Cpo102]MDM2817922.1 hypothetical protein [Citrobacter sp. Cpo102]
MLTINNRMTETQIADLFSLAVQLQVKAEESDDRDTAILAYSIQNACSNLTESQREFRAADATIHNLELKLTDMAVQLANAESKFRELAAENGEAKKIISECREYFIAGVMNRIRPTNEGYLHNICDTFADETPATDAFLAEVRAQGVDSAIDHLSKKFEVTGHIGVPVMALEWLAQEIRKGASL